MTKNNNDYSGLEDVWYDYIDIDEHLFDSHDHLENSLRGRGFSHEDRNRIKLVVKKIIEKMLLPHIERKIRNLESNIANTKKGVKNAFKNFWKKSERGENDGLKDSFKVIFNLN